MNKDDIFGNIKNPYDMPLYNLILSQHDMDIIVGCIKTNIENIRHDYRMFAGTHSENDENSHYGELLRYYDAQVNSQNKVLESLKKRRKIVNTGKFADYITSIANYLIKESYELSHIITVLSKWNNSHPNDITSKMLELRFREVYDSYWNSKDDIGTFVPQEDKKD